MGDWRDDAACRDVPPEAMFPDDADRLGTWEAKSVCLRCPVKADCLAWAVDHDVADGVWGGLTARQREAARKAGARP